MVCINYQCDNKLALTGYFGGLMCMCQKYIKERKAEKQQELKPCPFCGGLAKKQKQYLLGEFHSWAQCENLGCGASANIEAWNKRTA